MRAGERIVELRKQYHLTQAQLAELSGISQGSLSEIEAGKRAPILTTIHKICTGLGIKLNEFTEPLVGSDDFDIVADNTIVPAGQKVNPRIEKIVRQLYTFTPDQLQLIETLIKAMKSR